MKIHSMASKSWRKNELKASKVEEEGKRSKKELNSKRWEEAQ